MIVHVTTFSKCFYSVQCFKRCTFKLFMYFVIVVASLTLHFRCRWKCCHPYTLQNNMWHYGLVIPAQSNSVSSFSNNVRYFHLKIKDLIIYLLQNCLDWFIVTFLVYTTADERLVHWLHILLHDWINLRRVD